MILLSFLRPSVKFYARIVVLWGIKGTELFSMLNMLLKEVNRVENQRGDQEKHEHSHQEFSETLRRAMDIMLDGGSSQLLENKDFKEARGVENTNGNPLGYDSRNLKFYGLGSGLRAGLFPEKGSFL